MYVTPPWANLSLLGNCLFFGSFLMIYRSSPKIWATFFHGKSSALLLIKMGWAKFCVIFSQTHLVALVQKNYQITMICFVFFLL
jgi:hypothetical protein